MQNAVTLIAAYKMGFYVCAAITLISLASAVLMFFRFDIRTILAIRTGRAERITVERMRTVNQKTGTLKTVAEPSTPTESLNLGQNETILLRTEDSETVRLKQQPTYTGSMTEPLKLDRAAGKFKFTITENTVVIHTDVQV